MRNAATQAKQRWNSKHYTQVKFSIDPEVASAFKTACASFGVSMSSRLAKYMVDYTNTTKKSGRLPDYTTKRQRRSAVKAIVQQLALIKAAEEQCRDNIPLNLQAAETFENACECASSLEEVIELLGSIY